MTGCRCCGAAIGAGWMLALLTDRVVAARSASFAFPEIDLGTPTPLGIAVLEFWCPPVVASDLVQSGRRIEATEAARLGLVSEIVEPGAVLDAAQRAAEAYAAKPAQAYAVNKRFQNRHRRTALAAAAEAARAARDAH